MLEHSGDRPTTATKNNMLSEKGLCSRAVVAIIVQAAGWLSREWDKGTPKEKNLGQIWCTI